MALQIIWTLFKTSCYKRSQARPSRCEVFLLISLRMRLSVSENSLRRAAGTYSIIRSSPIRIKTYTCASRWKIMARSTYVLRIYAVSYVNEKYAEQKKRECHVTKIILSPFDTLSASCIRLSLFPAISPIFLHV